MKYLKTIVFFLLISNLEYFSPLNADRVKTKPCVLTRNVSMKGFAELSQNVFKKYVEKRDNSKLGFTDIEILPFRQLDSQDLQFLLNFFFLMHFSFLQDSTFNKDIVTNENNRKDNLYLDAIKGLLIVLKLFYGKKSCSLFDLSYLYKIVWYADYPLFVFCMQEFFDTIYRNKIVNIIYEYNENGFIYNITLLDLANLMYKKTGYDFPNLKYSEIINCLRQNNGISALKIYQLIH